MINEDLFSFEVYDKELRNNYENYKGTTDGSQKESLSIPSIVRQAQAENMEAFIEKIQNDEKFVQKWIKVTKDNINHSRKATKELLDLDEINDMAQPKAA